ncbi:unnamed protein product [Didymodactylos carnosus]|uniref:Uncharacterized protein n=1 Tax=Didymodactylos carnosus TaxID=1234261 RepID=A0A8S2EG27_9BILA|nr:unnamed protein product [Didymodactylos carnosus]CAF4006434.1 unnamed protein product [Didymodactylos carnosus]
MARANLSSSSIDDDLVIDSPPPATQPINKEQLKLKFKLAVIDDIENQKGREVKEKTDEIKSLLSKRTDRFTVVAHGVTKPHVATSNEAQQSREQITELIKEPVKSQSLTVPPDMWSDRYRQLSYLGVTVTFVDLHLHFRKFTLCCRSFPVELTKAGENISEVKIFNSVRN